MFEPVRIAPSILSADFLELGRDVGLVEDAGAGFVHVDVMDGHFVPNTTIGVPVVAQLARTARLPLDVHLMVGNPLTQLPWFLDALSGAPRLSECVVTVHAEALYGDELSRAVGLVREAGALPAVALRPRTPAEALEGVLADLGMVLVMSVEPGFSGQRYIPGSERKVARVAAMAQAVGAAPLIEVDGGVGIETAPLVAAAGADVLVCGNAFFGAEDPVRALESVRSAANAARLAGLARAASPLEAGGASGEGALR